VLHPLAVSRLAEKPRNRGAVLPQLFAEDLHGNGSVVGVLGTEDGRCPALTHFALQRISSNRLSNKVFAGHAANLIARSGCGKQTMQARTKFISPYDCHTPISSISFAST
jgi:hypothetical protein